MKSRPRKSEATSAHDRDGKKIKRRERNDIPNSPSNSFELSETEAVLLKELGFTRGQPLRGRIKLLDRLTMRQLDRLKMMFFRIDFEKNELFEDRLKDGIHANELRSYAEAIHLLFINT